LYVFGLARGGVPVAYEVARALGAPLDVMVVRKVAPPGHEELALGALASGGYRFVNEEMVELFGFEPDLIDALAAREEAELERQEHELRGDRPLPDLKGKTVILVDDGLATGASMRAAVAAIRATNAAQVVAAIPVAAPEGCDAVAEQADDTVCGFMPQDFLAVGQWYEEFAPTSDEEVRELLARAA
jgi:predicted phosphoribosyltransferase